MEIKKTHWLQNPNKNYLGHQDLPNGKPLILTIKSAQWEQVENPIARSVEAKRVIRFEEEGIKPFICNEVNSQSIIKSTKEKFMEDSVGYKIMLTVGETKVMGNIVDCLRVKDISQEELNRLSDTTPIDKKQLEELLGLLSEAEINIEEFCLSMKIKSASELPSRKYDQIKKRLLIKIEELKNK